MQTKTTSLPAPTIKETLSRPLAIKESLSRPHTIKKTSSHPPAPTHRRWLIVFGGGGTLSSVA